MGLFNLARTPSSSGLKKASRPAVLPAAFGRFQDKLNQSRSPETTYLSLRTPLVERSEFVRLQGELLARWTAANVEGVGDAVPQRLVRGIKNLNQAVKNHDVALISSVAAEVDAANKLIAQWLLGGDAFHVGVWLQESQLPLGIADCLARVYVDTARSTKADLTSSPH